MSSKLLLQFRFLKSAFFLLLLSFTGCEFLNETHPQPKEIVINLQYTECLSNLLPVVEEYIDGKAKDEQIIYAWDCLGEALTEFEKSVQGRYEDRFTSRELAHFFEQYFLAEGQRIPKSLLIEAFKVKQLFVGGYIDSISRAEMRNSIQVFQDLKKITLNLNPYMKVYNLTWGLDEFQTIAENVSHFNNANLAIQQAAKDLAQVISKNGMPYVLDNVVTLLREFEAFSSKNWPWIASVEKTMPLIKKLKITLTGTDEALIGANEWQQFALLGARGYVQYLRYYYFIKSSVYSKGEAELAYLMDSVHDLFSYLGDMVDNKPTKLLTRTELLEILQALSSFVPNFKISDQLLIEAMKVKVVFFGGNVEYFEKSDFERAQKKLDDFKALTGAFLKYSDVFTLVWKPEELSSSSAQTHFTSAEDHLHQVAKALGKNMEAAYDLRDLVLLAIEIDSLYEIRFLGEKNLSAALIRYMPVIISVKNILFSDKNSIVAGNTGPREEEEAQNQWSQFLEVAARLYARYLSYHYFLKGKPLTEGKGLQALDVLVEDTTKKVIDYLIGKKQRRVIPIAELSALIKSVEEAKLLPENLTADLLNPLVPVLVNKILIPPEDRLDGKDPNGVTRVTTKEIRNLYSGWSKNQEFLDVIYKDEASLSAAYILTAIDATSNLSKLTERMELKMIFSSPLVLSFDSVGRIQFSQPPLNFKKKTATLINTARAAVQLGIRSYAMNLDRINKYEGITNEEANVLFHDVRPLVVKMGLISPDNIKFANSRFRDANLFTSVGNGDELADFRELSNLVLLITSGSKVDSLIYEKLESACQVQKPTSQKFDWKVHRDCVQSLYHQEIPSTFNSMPDWVNFHNGLTPEKFQQLHNSLLLATEAKIDANGWVNVGDLGLYAHLVQYIEGLFQLYDVNRNSILETEEAMQAYPRYRSILLKVSGLEKENELRGLYSWLLKNGKPPTTPADKAKFKMVWCKMKEEDWKLAADRSMLATILGFIAQAMAENP